MLGRILTAFYIVDLAFREEDSDRRLIAFVIVALPFVLAVPYEALREVSDRRVVKRVEALWMMRSLIYLLVGVGFALRVVIGVLIGTNFEFHIGAAATLFVAASLMGSAETLAIWGIAAGVGQSTEGVNVRADTAPLAKHLEFLTRGRTKISASEKLRIVRDNPRSPWVAYYLASVGIASIFGLQLSGFPFPATVPEWQLWACFTLGWMTVAAVCVRLHVVLAILMVSVIATLASVGLWQSFGLSAAVAPVAVTGLMFIHLGDRFNSHNDFVTGAMPVLRAVGRHGRDAIGATLRLFFGKQTSKVLFGSLAERVRQRR